MMNGSGRLSDGKITKMIVGAEKLKGEDQLWNETMKSMRLSISFCPNTAIPALSLNVDGIVLVC